MKLKYYLRGAGIGVIVATLILMIAFSVYRGKTEEKGQAETENVSTDLTIAEALSEMETETNTETTEAKTTETEAVAAAPEETEADTGEEAEGPAEESEEPAETTDEMAAEAGGSAEAPEATDAETLEPDESEVSVQKTVSVVIQGGDSPMAVAHKLVTAGAVDDENQFYRYLLDHGLNDGIEIGSFSIPEGADYETVARIITTNEYEGRMQR